MNGVISVSDPKLGCGTCTCGWMVKEELTSSRFNLMRWVFPDDASKLSLHPHCVENHYVWRNRDMRLS